METKVWLFCTFHCESKSTLLLVHFFSLFTHSIVFGNFKKWNEKHTNEQQESSKRVRNGWSNDATTTAAEKSNVFRFRWHTKCEHSTSRTTWLARRSLIHCFLVVCTCWLVLSSYIPSPDAAADGIYESNSIYFHSNVMCGAEWNEKPVHRRYVHITGNLARLQQPNSSLMLLRRNRYINNLKKILETQVRRRKVKRQTK